MKRLGLFFAIIIAATVVTGVLKAQQKQDQKRYKVEMTIPEWETRLSQLEWVKQQIKLSDMPTRNGIIATDSILNPIIQQIYYQINMQIQSEQKQKSIQPNKDSTNKSKSK